MIAPIDLPAPADQHSWNQRIARLATFSGKSGPDPFRPTARKRVTMTGVKQKGLPVQEASQRLTSIVLGLPGHAGIRRTIEAVIRPRIHVQLDRYSGAAQSIRIG